MPVEIEIKLKIDDPAPVRERLKSLGAEPRGDVMEINVFLDTADRALLMADCGLRLRRNRRLADGSERLFVTFKGPRDEGPVKQREEIEVAVDNLEQMKVLLKRLGYEETLCFEKRRQSWQLGRCMVELDELPRLGWYVEVEGPSETDVTDAQQQLGLASLPPIAPTYADLVTRQLSDSGEHEKRLTFNS